MKFIRFWFCLLGVSIFSGCVYHEISNLTPVELPRNSSGFYPVEIIWESNSPTVQPKGIKPVVLVGANIYPMQKLLAADGKWVENRWQTLIPVGPQQNELRYRVKVNWNQSSFGSAPKGNSQITEERTLRINDWFSLNFPRAIPHADCFFHERRLLVNNTHKCHLTHRH